MFFDIEKKLLDEVLDICTSLLKLIYDGKKLFLIFFLHSFHKVLDERFWGYTEELRNMLIGDIAENRNLIEIFDCIASASFRHLSDSDDSIMVAL